MKNDENLIFKLINLIKCDSWIGRCNSIYSVGYNPNFSDISDISKDCRFIFYECGNGIIHIYDTESDTIKQIITLDNGIEQIKLSDNGDYLAFIQVDSVIGVFNVNEGKKVFSAKEFYHPNNISFSKDSKFCAITEENWGVDIWNLDDGTLKKSINTNTSKNTFYNEGYNLLGNYSQYNLVVLIDPYLDSMSNRYQYKNYFDFNGYSIIDFDAPAFGNYIVAATTDSIVSIMDMNTKQIIKKYRLFDLSPRKVKVSDNGKYIACLDDNSSLIVWDSKDYIVGVNDTYSDNGSKLKLIIQPNPVSGAALIKYQVTTPGLANITLTNLIGSVQQTLLNERKDTGEYIIEFNTSGLPAGVYFLRYALGTQSVVTKFILY